MRSTSTLWCHLANSYQYNPAWKCIMVISLHEIRNFNLISILIDCYDCHLILKYLSASDFNLIRPPDEYQTYVAHPSHKLLAYRVWKIRNRVSFFDPGRLWRTPVSKLRNISSVKSARWAGYAVSRFRGSWWASYIAWWSASYLQLSTEDGQQGTSVRPGTDRLRMHGRQKLTVVSGWNIESTHACWDSHTWRHGPGA